MNTQFDDQIHCLCAAEGTVTCVGNETYLAELQACRIGASGDTHYEAMDNLRDTVAAKYRLFSEIKPEHLGVIPRRQLDYLKSALNGTFSG